MSQKEAILKFLKTHKRITPWTAFEYLRITKLSTRAGELIREGHPLKKEKVTKNGHWCMAYSL